MFFEGLINMQLPFILISSGISSGLYLLFLFFNIGQTTDVPVSNNDKISYNIEVTTDDNSNQDCVISIHEYYNQNYINTELKKFNPKLSENLIKPPLECRSFKPAYSFHFAQASFSRPPPSV